MIDWQEGPTKGTMYKEKVGMICPLLFSYVCRVETDRNRNDFMQNLKKSFTK